jgi:hypothetical protein
MLARSVRTDPAPAAPDAGDIAPPPRRARGARRRLTPREWAAIIATVMTAAAPLVVAIAQLVEKIVK